MNDLTIQNNIAAEIEKKLHTLKIIATDAVASAASHKGDEVPELHGDQGKAMFAIVHSIIASLKKSGLPVAEQLQIINHAVELLGHGISAHAKVIQGVAAMSRLSPSQRVALRMAQKVGLAPENQADVVQWGGTDGVGLRLMDAVHKHVRGQS